MNKNYNAPKENATKVHKKFLEWMGCYPEDFIGVEINSEKKCIVHKDIEYPIQEYGCIVISPEGQKQVFSFSNLKFACRYCYERDTFKGYISVDGHNIFVSRKNSYSAKHSFVFYCKNKYIAMYAILSKPLIHADSISGLAVEIGVQGKNYNQVNEAISAIISLTASEEMKDEVSRYLEKQKSIDNQTDINFKDYCEDFSDDTNLIAANY